MRIYGTETEFGLYLPLPGEKVEPLDFRERVAKRFQEFTYGPTILKFYDIPNSFLYNGGLFHKELPSGTIYGIGGGTWNFTPEYATPECLNPRDLVCWEKAGEIIISRMFDLDESRAFFVTKCGRGIPRDDIKTITGGYNYVNSGHHENYSIPFNRSKTRDLFFVETSKTAQYLVTFLVSRVILNGCGWFDLLNPRIPYLISSRAGSIVNVFSEVTAGHGKAVVCMARQSSHDSVAREDLSRLHLILGDHNLSEMSLFLTVGTTGLVLRMLEENALMKGPILTHPVNALSHFSADPFLQNIVELEEQIPGNGSKFVSALDLQDFFCRQARIFVDKNPSSPEERELVAYWEDVLSRLRSDVFSLNQELDWVIKLDILRKYLNKYRKNWQDVYNRSSIKIDGLNQKEVKLVSRCSGISLAYHDLSARGLYNRLKNQGKIKRLLSDQEINKAVLKPPQNTRAKIRGEVINFIRDHNISEFNLTSDWKTIRLRVCETEFDLIMDDPFDFTCSNWQNIKRKALELIRNLD